MRYGNILTIRSSYLRLLGDFYVLFIFLYALTSLMINKYILVLAIELTKTTDKYAGQSVEKQAFLERPREDWCFHIIMCDHHMFVIFGLGFFFSDFFSSY